MLSILAKQLVATLIPNQITSSIKRAIELGPESIPVSDTTREQNRTEQKSLPAQSKSVWSGGCSDNAKALKIGSGQDAAPSKLPPRDPIFSLSLAVPSVVMVVTRPRPNINEKNAHTTPSRTKSETERQKEILFSYFSLAVF